MSDARAAPGAAQRFGSGAGRLVRAWRILAYERRLAAFAAVGLFLTLFLPWYQETVLVATGARTPVAASVSVTGWGAFSFVEAAVLLVAAGVLVLLFQRAEGKAFHLPGGDGWVVTAAGFWTCVLIVWRIFDKQSTAIHGPGADISGIEWGIFVALAVAAFLVYAGSRIRAAHQPEPPLPGEEPRGPTVPTPPSPQRRRATTPRPVAADVPAPGRAVAPPADAVSRRAPADAVSQPAPARRGRARAQRAEAPPVVGDAPVTSEDWVQPSTDWIDAGRARPPRDAGEDPFPGEEPPARRIPAAEEPPTRQIAGEEPPARRIPAAEEPPTRQIAGEEPPTVVRNGADEGPPDPLGPSTQAARRARRLDDQMTIPLERED